MSWGSVAVDPCCPDWLIGTAGNNGGCEEAQTPGFDTRIYLVCFDQFIVTIAPSTSPCFEDVANSIDNRADVISRLVKRNPTKAIVLNAQSDTVGITSSGTRNDNNGIDISETITGIASITNCNKAFFDAYLTKQVIALVCDNNDNAWVFGHTGGLRLNDYTADWGVASGDGIGITFNFTNTSKKQFLALEEDASFYNDTTYPTLGALPTPRQFLFGYLNDYTLV